MSDPQLPDNLETPVEIIVNPDPKPGLKTTEFWVILAANVIVVALAMLQKIDAAWAAGAVTVLSGIYAVLRNLLKTASTREAGKSVFTWLLLLGAGCLLLPSCGISFTSDGCILGKYQKGSSSYYAGPCVGADLDGDGEAEVDRYRVKWRNADGDQIRATYTTASKSVLVEYLLENGLWIGWSSKSGVSLGPVPPEVEEALAGNPAPVPAPTPGLPAAP